MEQMAPGYAGRLKMAVPSKEYIRLMSNFYKNRHATLPPASTVFPAINPQVDPLLRRLQLDRNVAVCDEVAALPRSEQQDFLNLYRHDPDDARLWARLPRWKRPLRKGDRTDQQIWKFFVQFRLLLESLAQGHAISLPNIGYMVKPMGGTLQHITDINRFSMFLTEYGDMLYTLCKDATFAEHREKMGDLTTKPWEQR